MVEARILINLLEKMQNEDSDQRMQNLRKEDRWRSIPRAAAETLSVLVRSFNAKTIVEIGTSHGYSTIWLGLAAKSTGGKVFSFEIEESRVKKARENVKEAGLDDWIEIYHASPLENPELLQENIDFVFLDAEKKDYENHFGVLFDKLRVGGTIAADNIISHFRDLRGYIELVRNHPQCNSILLSSTGNGIEITYKLHKSELDIPWNDLIR